MTRVRAKCSSDDTSRSNAHAMNEARLWRAVLAQAANDCVWGDSHMKLENAEWLFTEDFSTVAEMAQVNEDMIKSIFIEILKADKHVYARYHAKQLMKCFEYYDADSHLYSVERLP